VLSEALTLNYKLRRSSGVDAETAVISSLLNFIRDFTVCEYAHGSQAYPQGENRPTGASIDVNS